MIVKEEKYKQELTDIINGLESQRFDVQQFKKKPFKNGTRYTITIIDNSVLASGSRPNYKKKQATNETPIKKEIKKEKIVLPAKPKLDNDLPQPAVKPQMAEITSLGKM